ncbi:MAG: RNA polymerase sigma factor [Phycisphaera sp.]|nr:MAG: RNA polymerase sigma factor [Phycisphaera sp.]
MEAAQRQPAIESASDEALLSRFARSGARPALEELAGRHEHRLLGLALGLCNGREDLAREAVQETWVRVIRHAGTFRGKSSFATWVYRIAVHRCRDVMAKERAVARRARRASEGLPGGGSATDLDWARGVVGGLPQREREVVLLCHMRGMTHEQAAAVLGIPPGTLKTRMTRAMKRLRETMGGDA